MLPIPLCAFPAATVLALNLEDQTKLVDSVSSSTPLAPPSLSRVIRQLTSAIWWSSTELLKQSEKDVDDVIRLPLKVRALVPPSFSDPWKAGGHTEEGVFRMLLAGALAVFRHYPPRCMMWRMVSVCIIYAFFRRCNFKETVPPTTSRRRRVPKKVQETLEVHAVLDEGVHSSENDAQQNDRDREP